MERVSHSSAILHSNYWCYVAWGRHCIVAASEVGGVWVACTAVSPRSLPLGVFREKERLRLSNRNSILTGLKTISGEVYGHDERPNTLKLGHVSFLAVQIYKTNNSKQIRFLHEISIQECGRQWKRECLKELLKICPWTVFSTCDWDQFAKNPSTQLKRTPLS